MKYKILLFIDIIFATSSQILMKTGVSKLGGLEQFHGLLPLLFAFITSPYIIIGLFLTGSGILLWLTIISNLELSFAYPFNSLSYVVILLYGALVLGENVNIIRISGVAMIIAGVIIISRTEEAG